MLDLKFQYLKTNYLISSAVGSLEPLLSKAFSPKGVSKLLYDPSGESRFTRHGATLTKELKITSPVLSQVKRMISSLDKNHRDGTISVVLFVTELVKKIQFHIGEGVHPRKLFSGMNRAEKIFLEFLPEKTAAFPEDQEGQERYCLDLLRTQLDPAVAAQFAPIVVECVLALETSRREGRLDFWRKVEVVGIPNGLVSESRVVEGLVLDHGPRHPKSVVKQAGQNCAVWRNCHVLCLNVDLEYEKTEVNSKFCYSKQSDLEKMAQVESDFVLRRVQKIVDLWSRVKGRQGEADSFLVINYQGIDPMSLDLLHKHGILGIRRAKRRNMERIVRVCGGSCVEDIPVEREGEAKTELAADCLGWAGKVTVEMFKDEKYTFLEEVKNSELKTVMIRGPIKSRVEMVEGGVRNAIAGLVSAKAHGVVKGSGGFELQAYARLGEVDEEKQDAGYAAFREALLAVPKGLLKNMGKAPTNEVGKLLREGKGCVEMDERSEAVLDSAIVKKEIYKNGSSVIKTLMLVDQIISPKPEAGDTQNPSPNAPVKG